MVSGIEVRVATTIIERHLDGLDVLIVDGDGVTAADGTATRAIAALCAACRPKGVAFVVRPSAELLAALDLGDFGEHLCAGVSAGDVWTSTS
jgi:anti-anti-sigma regulatory factor